MDDPILTLRLSLLEQNLNIVSEKTSYLLNELAELAMDSRLRQAVENWFVVEIQEKLKLLRGIRKIPDVKEAWSKYGALCEQSTRIYMEFLEALGGLAIRRNKLDDEICRIADELIGKLGVQGNSFTIPASQEAYSRTLARLVRMRFPEWTIWALPLTVHEFGHVWIDDSEKLSAFAEEEVEQAVRALPEFSEPHVTEDDAFKQRLEAAKMRVRPRIKQLLADAFAIYTLGPCYAYSLILLRLTPQVPGAEGHHAPAPERAFLVLEILKRMNEAAPKPLPYKEVLETLNNEWNGMNQRSGAPELSAARAESLRAYADRIWNIFDAQLFLARFPSSSPTGGGWNVARRWSENWEQYAGAGSLPLPEDVTASSKLRDALNAAWVYRLSDSHPDLNRVTVAALALCNKIVDRWYEQESGIMKKGRGPRAAAGR